MNPRRHDVGRMLLSAPCSCQHPRTSVASTLKPGLDLVVADSSGQAWTSRYSGTRLKSCVDPPAAQTLPKSERLTAGRTVRDLYNGISGLSSVNLLHSRVQRKSSSVPTGKDTTEAHPHRSCSPPTILYRGCSHPTVLVASGRKTIVADSSIPRT